MKAITLFLESLIDEVILDPTTTSGGANTALRAVTNGVTNAEASAWYDELELIYQSVGLINNNTWAAWRNFVVNDGAVIAKAAANMATSTIANNIVMADVNLALHNKKTEDDLAAVKADIVTVRDARNLETDPALITALNVGLDALKLERDGLQQRVDNNV